MWYLDHVWDQPKYSHVKDMSTEAVWGHTEILALSVHTNLPGGHSKCSHSHTCIWLNSVAT